MLVLFCTPTCFDIALSPLLYGKLNYDPWKDLAPIALVGAVRTISGVADALRAALRFGGEPRPDDGSRGGIQTGRTVGAVMHVDPARLDHGRRRRVTIHRGPVAERLAAAGTVLLGKTHMHELAYGVTSNNPHFGPVRNPWNTGRVPGGSSGGSGAAVAAGDTLTGKMGKLKKNTEEAVTRGVFGAPTFFVGEQMFWGQDRLEFVREALA